jgi:pimeloyl-ACP methyl ester carboxylesterase
MDAAVPDAAALPDAAMPDAGPAPLVFTACPLVTGGSGSDAECARMQVPLFWENPDAGTLEVSIKRWVGEEPSRQIWLLQGGPGGSALVFENLAAHFSSRAAGATVYMFEHRGVGMSTRLGCPQEDPDADGGTGLDNSEVSACLNAARAQWGEGLKGFTTTAAARDLGHAMERTSTGVTERFVYGVSYGTYWAERYLQLFPTQATGVILDSICSPGARRLPMGFATNHNTVAMELLRLCGLDATCSARVGADPVTMAQGLFARIAGGHCAEVVPAVLGVNEIKALLGSLLQNVGYRVLVPALLHRLDRCDAADVQTFVALKDLIRPSAPAPADRAMSTVLYAVVARAELWDDPPLDTAAVQAALDGLVVAAASPLEVIAAMTALETYTPDAYFRQFPNTSIPVLMMNGTLDPQTPPSTARPMGMHLAGPHQTYVEVDRAAHAIITQSRYESDPLRTCGWDLIEQFVTAPLMDLDTSCSTTVETLRFGNDAVLAQALLGTGDLYDNLSLASVPPSDQVQMARADFTRWRRILPPFLAQ